MGADLSFLTPGGALAGPLFARLLEDQERDNALPAGTAIGAYRIVEVLGRGGSGVVYRAERADGAFAHTVALKVLRPDTRLIELFRRERNILGQLAHPGIARILDGGETAEGALWYAMECVEGERIDQWCEHGRCDWRARLRLLVQLAEAVQYAHARLVVHGDIKPGNVLVDERGQARLLDFGISRQIQQSADERPANDEPAAFTPAFASPEQVADASIGTASDVFQMGRLIELLVGPQVAAIDAPPLARENLAAITARATEHQPGARYASVGELRVDLQRALEWRPAIAGNWRLRQRGRFFLARNRALVGVVSVALLIVLGLATHFAWRVARERERTEQQARNAQVTTEVLANLFRTATPLNGSGEQLSARQILDRGAGRALQRLRDAPQQRAIAVEALAAGYRDLGAREQAAKLIDSTLDELEPLAPALAVERGRLWTLLAMIAIERNDAEGAQAGLAHARELLQLLPESSEERERLEATEIDLLAHRNLRAEADARRDRLILRIEQTADVRTPLYAELLNERSVERNFAADFSGAIADARKALAIYSERYGPSSPQALRLQRHLIWLHQRGDAPFDVQRLLAEQRQIVLSSFGERSTEFADVIGFEGIVAWERADLDTAHRSFERSLEILRDSVGNDNALVAGAAHNLADVLLEQGDAAAALTLYQEALALRLRLQPSSHQTIVVNRLQIARAQCQLGQYEAGIAGLEVARAALAERMGPTHPALLVAAATHADCLWRQGRVDDARALLHLSVPADRVATLGGMDRRRIDRIVAQIEGSAH